MRINHRGREVSRLEAFSDGVFAFAATLLVVSLEVPRTFPDLVRDLNGFVGFSVSFAMLVLIWSVHNGFFRRYGLQDPTTVILNSCLLFLLLVYIYPLKFMTSMLTQAMVGGIRENPPIRSIDELATLFAIYSGAFAAGFLCVALMYRHAWRKREELELTPAEIHDARTMFRHYMIMVSVGIASVIAALLGIGLAIGFPGWMYGFLGPLCYFHGVWSGKRAPAPAAPVTA